jgi:hypothetical protein
VAKSKTVTREQAEAMKAKAGDFMERMGDDDRAADFDAMSIDEYADHKGLTLSNPPRRGRKGDYQQWHVPADRAKQTWKINSTRSTIFCPTHTTGEQP